MKTKQLHLILFFAFVTGLSATAQKPFNEELLTTLPENLELKDEVQKYKVTTDHFNGDMFGNFFNKFRVTGEYTRGLDGGKVKWNNVSVATAMQRDADFPAGARLGYMENYTYEPSPEMLNPEKFTTFTEHSAYAKNLIWDVMGMEGFAWAYFDKLKLNEPYSAESFNGRMELAGQGFFENRNVVLTWTGVSKMNGEPCATIEYRTMDNPVEYAEESMSMKGRSHYWGTIWVSLTDKQIEHANLYEDVIMEMQFTGQPNKQIMNITREITFEKQIRQSL